MAKTITLDEVEMKMIKTFFTKYIMNDDWVIWTPDNQDFKNELYKKLTNYEDYEECIYCRNLSEEVFDWDNVCLACYNKLEKARIRNELNEKE